MNRLKIAIKKPHKFAPLLKGENTDRISYLKLFDDLNNAEKKNVLISYLTLTTSYTMINAFLCISKKNMNNTDFTEFINSIFKSYMYNIYNAIHEYRGTLVDYEGIILYKEQYEIGFYESILISDFPNKFLILYHYCNELDINLLYEYSKSSHSINPRHFLFNKKIYFLKLMIKYIKYMKNQNKNNDFNKIIYYILKLLYDKKNDITNFNFKMLKLNWIELHKLLKNLERFNDETFMNNYISNLVLIKDESIKQSVEEIINPMSTPVSNKNIIDPEIQSIMNKMNTMNKNELDRYFRKELSRLYHPNKFYNKETKNIKTKQFQQLSSYRDEKLRNFE